MQMINHNKQVHGKDAGGEWRESDGGTKGGTSDDPYQPLVDIFKELTDTTKQDQQWSVTCPQCGQKIYDSTKERVEWEYRQHKQAHQQQQEQQEKERYDKSARAWEMSKGEWSVGPIIFKKVPLWDKTQYFYGVEYRVYNGSKKSQSVMVWVTESKNIENLVKRGDTSVPPGEEVSLGYVKKVGAWSSEGWSVSVDYAPKTYTPEKVVKKPVQPPSVPRIQGTTPGLLREEKTELEPTEKKIRAVPVPEFWENVKNHVKFSDPRAEEIKNEGVNLLAQSPSGKEILDFLAKSNVPIGAGTLNPWVVAQYDPATKKITVNEEALKNPEFNRTDFAVTLAHEGQHARQHIEGGTIYSSVYHEYEAHLEQNKVYAEARRSGAPPSKGQIEADYKILKSVGIENYQKIVHLRYNSDRQLALDMAKLRIDFSQGKISEREYWLGLKKLKVTSSFAMAYGSGKTPDEVREQRLPGTGWLTEDELKKTEKHYENYRANYKFEPYDPKP
ncbi:MAG: hypothetical protein CVU77_04325 [Elusimicrobia bacterium HGW-Elusimicrobia-1]|nr:MAG: hypothetical protein CVU77_04325 [Elusimicrobia bacterium HGW-Elusimicrobia-1]